jgi:hypothetical protein
MFSKLFKRSKPSLPAMPFLETYAHRDSYIYRLKSWSWLNDTQITIPTILEGEPTMVTMDFWYQEIFLDADGTITVKTLLELICSQYHESKIEIPNEVDRIMIEFLEVLINDYKFVAFSDQPVQLDSSILNPISHDKR